MPHSFAQDNPTTCPHCEQAFTYVIWLIVDGDERPDLLAYIQAGTLHTITCPHCHTELGQADAPLLIYHPSQQPVLLFSPAQQTSQEEDGQHFQGLLGMLQEQTHANWTQDWLQANVEAVPRQLLPVQLGAMPTEAMLRQMAQQMAQQLHNLSEEDPELAAQLAQLLEGEEEGLAERLAALVDEKDEEEVKAEEQESGGAEEQGSGGAEERGVLINQFIQQETWLGSYQFAREHPKLLAEETIQHLEILLVINAGNEGAMRVLTEHLELLQACRTHGLAKAFATKLGMSSVEELEMAVAAQNIPPELRQLLQELAQSGEINSPEDLERLLAQRPDLQAQLAHMAEQSQPRGGRLNIPPELQPLIDELVPLNRPHEMPRKIELLQQALQRLPRPSNPPLWAALCGELANSVQQNPLGDRAENIEQAIQLYEQALQVRTRTAMPTDWAQTISNLATAYSDRIRGERAQNIEQAIQLYEQALQVRTRAAMPTDWATSTMNLANAYRNRIRGERAQNIEQAIQLYEQALTIFTVATLPADHQNCQRNLGNLHFGEGQWAQSLAAYRGAIEANQLLLATASTREGQLAEVGEVSTLFARTAYALLQLGRFGEALVQLDGGKARLLTLAVRQEEAELALLTIPEQAAFATARATFRDLQAERQLPPHNAGRRPDSELAPLQEQALTQLNETIAQLRAAHPDFMPEGLDLPALLALIPVGGALIAPVVTSHGGGVLVVPHGVAKPTAEHYLSLPQLTEEQVGAWVIGTEETPGWLGIYINYINNPERTIHDLAGWHSLLNKLNQHLLTPIQEKLATLHIQHGAELLLMPQGRLGLLPLHAAWLGAYTVRYTPSGVAVQASLRRGAEGQRSGGAEGRLLAVVNPTADLPFTPYEGAVVAGLFAGEKTVYNEGQATHAAVVAHLPQPDYLHFSCHGTFGWGDAAQSGLLLADGRLTMPDILRQRLRPARLVVLSACETGITEFQKTADEFLGLPAAFLQAGAMGVVSTLWAVNDLSTALLMEKFYTLHLGGTAPAQALREAQLWLRGVSAGHLAAQLHAQRQALSHAGQQNSALYDYVVAMEDHFSDLPASDSPYADPYYWAAFTFSGV